MEEDEDWVLEDSFGSVLGWVLSLDFSWSSMVNSSKHSPFKTSRYPYKGSSGVLSKGLVSMRPTTTGPGLW